MTFERAFKQNLFRQVADQIEQAILAGTFPPGHRLPGEHDLAEQFGVSRNVVREALKSLEQRGLIVVRTGRGAYVTSPSSEIVSDAFSRFIRQGDLSLTLGDFYEMRRTLEGTAARLAAERAGEGDLAALEGLLGKMMAQRENLVEWGRADLAFHRAVAAATHNPLFNVLLDPIVDLIAEAIEKGFHVGGTDSGIKAHARILECIKAHDPQGAHEAMLAHLADSEERFRRVAREPGFPVHLGAPDRG